MFVTTTQPCRYTADRQLLLALLLALFLACLMPSRALGIDAIQLDIGDIETADWQAKGLHLSLNLADRKGEKASHISGELRAAELQLPAPIGQLKQTHLSCQKLAINGTELHCQGGRLRSQTPWMAEVLGKQALQIDLRLNWQTTAIKLRLKAKHFAKGQAAMKLVWNAQQQQMQLDAKDIAVEQLKPLLDQFVGEFDKEFNKVLNNYSYNGRVDIAVKADWPASSAQSSSARQQHKAAQKTPQIEANISLVKLQLSNAASTLATDGLTAALHLRGNPQQFTWSLVAGQGYAYADPLLFDFSQHKLQAHGLLKLTHKAAAKAYEIRGKFNQEQVVKGQAELKLMPGAEQPIQSLSLDIAEANINKLYSLYGQALLAGSLFAKLETQGQASGQLLYRSGELQRISLSYRDLIVDDSERRFALYGGNGVLHWQQDGSAAPSHIGFAGLYLYQLGFGQAELALQLTTDGLRLLQPTRIPFLNGALRLDALAIAGVNPNKLGATQPEAELAATLEPVRLGAITTAFGWPRFPGEVSGQLPPVSFKNNTLRMDGELTATAFGGNISVKGLALEDPFGTVPRLATDIQLQGLDLKKVTSVFDFGLMEGQLNVDIDGLRLQAWQPVAFNTRLYTPEDNGSRHRISQRAVQNISDIGGGGGATALLSNGFLSFFQDFAYDAIGWSCRLERNVCHMAGLGPAAKKVGNKRGYYIIKGKLLPRIDVIGYTTEVSWPVFLEQLNEAISSRAAEVR